ncbi:cyclin-dependent kinase inhibitor 1-like isoform X2 [Musa acuminata AAA Group]|uniref:cyclin-dependent kinase inhibitor 1 isoform X2 n=1 Tax=Musa acuminata AAA Group TaxID=214697 RepID=UPI0031D4AF78
MEVTQVAGARTRPQRTPVSALVSGCNRRKAAAAAAAAVAAAGVPTSYLCLRRRGLVVTTPGACTRMNAAATSEDSGDSEAPPSSFDTSRKRRGTTRSSELGSTAKTTMRSTADEGAPWEAEIDEFFATAERDASRRFAEKYNYDVIDDVPMEGRYDWARI